MGFVVKVRDGKHDIYCIITSEDEPIYCCIVDGTKCWDYWEYIDCDEGRRKVRDAIRQMGLLRWLQ